MLILKLMLRKFENRSQYLVDMRLNKIRTFLLILFIEKTCVQRTTPVSVLSGHY